MNNTHRKKWLFRVAAHANNGGGHVARSLVLARAMKRSEVIFSLSADSPYKNMILSEGFQITDTEKELPHYDGIWLDVYQDDFDYYRQKTSCLAIIEDHKDIYAKADIYIRPFPGQYSLPDHGEVYEGFMYSLVNPVFFNKSNNVINEQVKTVTIFMGRYDSVNAVTRILKILAQQPQDFHTNVVMGGVAAHLPSVRAYLESEYPRTSQLYVDEHDLSTLFAQSDLLILSGGVSALEACATGKPSIVINIKENQVPLSAALSRVKAIEYTGFISQLSDGDIEASFTKMMSKDVRWEMACQARKVLGENTVSRVAEILEKAGKGEIHAAYQYS